MMLFDQDLVAHSKQRCSFIDSLYATTSSSSVSPLQCLYDVKERSKHFENNFIQFLTFQRTKNPFNDDNLHFKFFFLIFFINLSVANCPPLQPFIHQRKIRKRPKTYKGIFLPPFRPFLVYVWGLLLRIW